jgi:uncharacterized protein YdiU (UPF0061 family)
MQKNSPFNFDYSYLSLPDKFYSFVKPQVFPKPEVLLFNQLLGDSLNLNNGIQDDFLSLISNKASDTFEKCFAQAYAGHQFGNFTKLGDGRAIILGEHLTLEGNRFDIQLKGSGRTPYSRGGDGKATLKAMLREYLVSEAMYYLNVPTSRSLAVFKTGDIVYRETAQEGAALVRVMKSHIRVGTFEYAAYFGSVNDLKALCDYTVKRLYPQLMEDQNCALSLLREVMKNQIDLVVNWMRVGFIHGVMNTDNTSISAETFDYGPCAFMNVYHPATVYSSIDQNGRYSFGNQARIIKWNVARFAEALFPILHDNKDKSLEIAQSVINEFDAIWEEKYFVMMLKKIGIETNDLLNRSLLIELLNIIQKLKLDYSNTFSSLSKALLTDDDSFNNSEFTAWLLKWKAAVNKSDGVENALKLMREVNPIVIPRNHKVEEALDEAVNGNLLLFNKLLSVISKPYQAQNDIRDYMEPPEFDFDLNYQTFCGT